VSKNKVADASRIGNFVLGIYFALFVCWVLFVASAFAAWVLSAVV